MTAVQHVILPPVPALAPFVTYLGYSTGVEDHHLERMMPNGSMALLVNLHEDEFRTYDDPDRVHTVAGAVLQGPTARPKVIDTALQREIIYVGFHLGGAYPFFDPPATEVEDGLVDLSELWGRDGSVVRERLLETPSAEGKLRTIEAVLLDNLARPPVVDQAMSVALKAFEQGESVAAVTDLLGMTSKRFIRTFTDQVGLTPKRYSRVRRFQRMLRALPYDRPVDWAEHAAATGYYDQSHLIHEFRDLAGINPTAYRPRSRGEHNHVPLR